MSPIQNQQQRRAIFPTYTRRVTKKELKTSFSPMVNLISIESQKYMNLDKKGEIWWQKSDYDGFRKAARIIARAMLQGGSEIWLESNSSCSHNPRSAASPRIGSSGVGHPDSLAARQAAFQKGDVNAKREYEETRDKWWHRFGHSRRGLEHIASIDEGRQRQTNVRSSVRAVMEEQGRQNMFQIMDPVKIRFSYIQTSSWARDLALASAASDANAVMENFDDTKRKPREFYLKRKFARSVEAIKEAPGNGQTVPTFMKPPAIPENRFDANTASQIRFRQAMQQKEQQGKKRTPPKPSVAPCMPEGSDIPESLSPAVNMARQAAGFSANGEEVANMSAVLTGMGPICKKAAKE